MLPTPPTVAVSVRLDGLPDELIDVVEELTPATVRLAVLEVLAVLVFVPMKTAL